MTEIKEDHWRERVIIERNELAEKLMRLKAFIDSSGPSDIGSQHYGLLIAQGYAMQAYLDMLVWRLRLTPDIDRE